MTQGAPAVPVVTVIIAACRARAFIADAVGSVLAQDFAALEIIVAPDEPAAGNDYSFLASLDPRILVLGEVAAPTGPGPARNRALGAARGDFIALLDADDLWWPGYLAGLVPAAQQRGAAFGRTMVTEWGGAVVRRVGAAGTEIGFGDFATAFASVHGLARNQPGRSWRDLPAEDVLFDLETLALAGGRAPFIADATYQLRLQPQSLTRGEDFGNRIGATYGTLAQLVRSGGTEVGSGLRDQVAAVFRSWQEMNAGFAAATAAGGTSGFQHFVAERERTGAGMGTGGGAR